MTRLWGLIRQRWERCKKCTGCRSAEAERAAVIDWLDNWAVGRECTDSAYDAGWGMAMYNAAREIERGDHAIPNITTLVEAER